MSLSRRHTLRLITGGVVFAATGLTAREVLQTPRTAALPWSQAGQYDDARLRALSYALLAPNPHNRQPWLVALEGTEALTLYADLDRLLPETDPFNRQITIGLGCFLETLRMAAAHEGLRAEIIPFPDGSAPEGLDARPIAHVRLHKDATAAPDPLFAALFNRRSTKEPYDTARPVAPGLLAPVGQAPRAGSRFGGLVEPEDIAFWRTFSHEALRIEVETPRTMKESADLFRIGAREVDAHPDGIDFTGPMFEALRLTGQFTRESASQPGTMTYKAGLDAVFANTDTAMGHIWLVTPTNDRADQIAEGADWMRVNLALTQAGLATQPLSQTLQEYPEMDALYRDIHARLAPDGGTVQMFARIGYGPDVPPGPRWPLDSRLL